MAQVGQLDFQGWVHRRKGFGEHDDGGDRGYAYVADRQTRATFEKIRPVQLAAEAAVRAFKAVGKNQLLGNAVKVGPRQFPRVHSLVSNCADTLGIAVPTVYIVNNPVVNAGTYGTNDDAFIVVHSGLVDHYSDDELRAVIGHECGHIHNNHVVYLTTLYYLTAGLSVFLSWIVRPALVALNAWSRRAEITSDRAALLCASSPEIATRSLTKLALGSQKLYEQLDLEAFLEQYEESQKGVGRLNELFATHPWLPKRVLSLRVFEKSRYYRRRAGLGDDGLTMDQVDEQVHDIVKVVG